MSKSKSKSNRVNYGFYLNFPKNPFTQRDLNRFKAYAHIKPITLYKRIAGAIEAGVLVVVGNKPREGERGRPLKVYARANPSVGVV